MDRSGRKDAPRGDAVRDAEVAVGSGLLLEEGVGGDDCLARARADSVRVAVANDVYRRGSHDRLGFVKIFPACDVCAEPR